MSRILWLHPSNFSGEQRSMLERYMHRVKLNPANIFFVSLHHKVSKMWVRKAKTKNKWICNSEKHDDVIKELDHYIKATKCSLIVVNDAATLGFITGNYTSLDLCRGSYYNYAGIPVLVTDSVLKAHTVKHFPWVMLQDLRKIKRWFEGEKRHEPKFNYSVVRNLVDIQLAMAFLNDCFFISTDIETAKDFITCVGFTGIQHDGNIWSFVFPFYNPLKPNNCHWDTEDEEVTAWKAVREICSNESIKTLQNGSYDSAYFIKYNIMLRNYFTDSLHLFHSIWTEAPKKLNFLTSLFVDHCRYWKDEAKGEKDERVPSTPDGIERYWRYNALDCHNTLLVTVFLLHYISRPGLDWARVNYNVEFSSQIGPALAMSMRGSLLNKSRQSRKTIAWLEEHQKNLKDLRIMVDDDEFNPNSPFQVASLLYDVLGVTPIKMKGKKKLGEHSTDEKILKLIRVQHPIFAKYIDTIWGTKKPLNNCSKYGTPSVNKTGKPIGLRTLNNRFMYSYSASGTETGRYSGKDHQFWIGTNPQNVPDKAVRDMIVADPGYVFFEPDYSQSDNYFVAFECEDADMMQIVTDDRDTHAVHAEFFFKKKYADIVAGHRENLDWVDHPTKGVRMNTKRIVHGSNYRMMGFTLYVTMGHEAVVETALQLGYKDAATWDRNKLVKLCETLLRAYLKLYPKLPEWFDTSVREAVKNGNRATCAFGRTRVFFGDLANDAAIQRELSAYFGQGGTAGNINDTLIKCYWESDLEKQGLLLMMQTHDSILTMVPEDKLWLCRKFLTIMEKECIVKERKFTVPVDANIGRSWGKKGMLPWRRDIELAEIDAHERKLDASYN